MQLSYKIMVVPAPWWSFDHYRVIVRYYKAYRRDKVLASEFFLDDAIKTAKLWEARIAAQGHEV
jgi:hypothetical protein